MKQKELTYIIVSIFLLIIVWIILSVYHSSITSTITPLVNVQITPITPSFDTKTLDDLKKRENITPVFEFGGGSVTVSSTNSATSSSSARTLP